MATPCRFSTAVLVLVAMAVPSQCETQQDSVAEPRACALGDPSCSDKSLLQKRKTEVISAGQVAEPLAMLMQEASLLPDTASSDRQGKLHSIMTQLVASKNELSVTPGLKESLEKIGEFVTVIKGKIDDEHQKSTVFAATQFGKFSTCSNELTTTTEGDVAEAKTAYEDLKTPNKECRDDESTEKDEHDACEGTESEKLGDKTTKCELFDEAERRAIDVAAHKVFVDFRADEASYPYITRLHLHFKELYDNFVPAKELCDTATTDHDNEQTKCDAAEAENTVKKDACDDIQENMDDAACGYAVKSKQSCTTYDACYSLAKTFYEGAVAMLQAAVADRKAEWEGAERISCLTGTFGDAEEVGSSHDAEGMQQCLTESIPTDHLNIVLEPSPAEDECTPDMTADPCSEEYKAQNVATLPANAPAQECRVCAGL